MNELDPSLQRPARIDRPKIEQQHQLAFITTFWEGLRRDGIRPNFESQLRVELFDLIQPLPAGNKAVLPPLLDQGGVRPEECSAELL